MAKNFYFKALDITLKDILHLRLSECFETCFGRMKVILTNDFRQILPISLRAAVEI